MALTTIDDRGLKTPIDLLDNEKIRFGTGNDLEIFHNGSHSYLVNNTGSFFIQAKDGEHSIKCVADAETELYYNNNKKFATNNDGFEIDNNATQSTIYLKASGTTLGYIFAGGGNEIGFKTASNEWGVQVDDGSEVALYYDNSKKIETTGSGATVTGTLFQIDESAGTSADGSRLDLKFGNNNSTDVISSITFSNGAGEAARIQAETNGANDSGLIKFYTDNAGTSAERVRIDENGDITVGAGGDLKMSSTGRIYIGNGGNASSPMFTNISDTNTGIAFPSADTMLFTTGGSESFRIDSSGRLLIGTDTEGHADGDDLTIATSSGYTGITLRSATDAGGVIYFSDATSGAAEYDGQIVYSQASQTMSFATAQAARLTILSAGDVKVNNGNLVVGTDGKGIDFSAQTQSTSTTNSEVLDHYEEGNWTPVFANGLVASAYENNGQRGTYTRIGNVVYITGSLHLSTASTQNNLVIDITGLPFTAGGSGDNIQNAGGVQNYYSDAFYNANDFSGIVFDSDTKIRLYKKSDGTYLTGSDVNGGREIRFNGSYLVPT